MKTISRLPGRLLVSGSLSTCLAGLVVAVAVVAPCVAARLEAVAEKSHVPCGRGWVEAVAVVAPCVAGSVVVVSVVTSRS